MRSAASAKDKLYEFSQVRIVLDSAVHLLSKNKIGLSAHSKDSSERLLCKMSLKEKVRKAP